MKKLFTVIFIMCFGIVANAQNAFFLNSPKNYLYLNPAHAGADSVHEFTLTAQTRWEGTYKTLMASYEQPLYKIHSGVGGWVMYDVSGDGQLTKYYVSPSFNYNIDLTKDMGLRIGVQPTYNYSTFNLEGVTFASQWNGTSFDSSPAVKLKYSRLDFSAGLWYTYKNLYAGFAVTNFGTIPLTKDYPVDDKDVPFNVAAGYRLKLSKLFTTVPSVLFMKNGNSEYPQLANDVIINNMFIVGASLNGHHLKEVSVRGGIDIDKKLCAMFSYSFINDKDLPQELKSFFTTYEATIRYMFR